MTRRTLPLLLAAALATAACASTTISAGGGPDRPVSTSLPPPSGSPPVVGKTTIVSPQPGLSDVKPLPWLEAEPSTDGRTLTVSFWGGVCMGIDHVGLDASPDTVTVTLYSGTPASTVGSVCPDIAMLMAVRVPLSSPLGDRTVVDGAA